MQESAWAIHTGYSVSAAHHHYRDRSAAAGCLSLAQPYVADRGFF